MPFQFYCPQGHLLEGQESQMGQQSQCPLCGMLFIVPVVGPSPSAAGGWSPEPGASMPGPFPSPEPASQPVEQAFPQIQTGPQQQSGAPAEPPPAAAEPPPSQPPPEPQPQEPRVLHIPCPQGHELETPLDMLGQEVMCPLCNVQFRLREEDSIEHKREQAEARRLREERLNRAVLRWSIVAAVVIVLAVAGMILYLALR